ncbi:MAG: hypothetical protein ACR2O3_07485 [Rhizobiaceae bacterium]
MPRNPYFAQRRNAATWFTELTIPYCCPYTGYARETNSQRLSTKVPEGDGYLAALTNFRFVANAVWSTEETIQNIKAAS